MFTADLHAVPMLEKSFYEFCPAHCPRRPELPSGNHVGFVVDPLCQVTPATPVEVVLQKDRNTSPENPGVSLACHLIQKSRLQSL